MKFRRIGARLAAAACVVAATVVLDTSTAHAELSDCAVSNPAPNRGSVSCASGTGQVRVVVTCVFSHTLNEYPVYGYWVGVGRTSTASCGTSGASWLLAVDYELQP